MDYTQSNAFATHAGTGNRMHNASQATPTAVSDADLNGPVWELVSLVKQAGITPAGFDANTPVTYQQVAAAIAALQRQQTNTAYTTAGTAPAFTVTLPASAVALAALGTNLRLRLKFHAAGAGSDTLNIAGLGAKSLKQYDSTGAKVAGVIAAGQLVDVEYDGTDFVLLDPLPSAMGNFSNNRSRSISSAVTLSRNDSGTCFELGSAASVTLPLCSSVPVGTTFVFTTSPAVTTATINRQGGGDTIAINNGGAFTSYTMGPGSDIMFINDGTVWRGNFGSETLRTNSPLFLSSKTANGYQKIAGGLIFQWGSAGAAGSPNVTISFPIQFPNACLHVIPFYEGGSAASSGVVGFSTSQAVIQLSGGTPSYFAIGY
ncbi:gp53-like domain-containing protein [Limnohabitans sp.]|uniref:gp53-like domain-containing protein n=1 Tax=Limnohabitans sp. TaxID=1907725 RepID=UPI00286F460B|nr:hypothetical protein [Limnohabitans sp.]